MKKIEIRIEKGLCTGCGLCVDSPKSMRINSNGYLRPINPIEDLITKNNCPAISINNFAENCKYYPLWGPIITCHQGYSTDPNVRRLGSSGGVLSQIAIFLLEKNEVDEIIHIGADINNPALNQTIFSSCRDDVVNSAGSRYAPSAPLSVIRSLLGNGKRYALIAKPCDIAAMRSFVATNPEYADQFKYLLSFFCAGIPSQHATSMIIEKLQTTESNLKSFRYRGNGWPGLTTAQLKDGTFRTMTYNDAWGKILNQHLQTRCKLCPDGIGEAADIVCADAWEESESGYPSFSERDGQSLVICRTEVGVKVRHAMLVEKKLECHYFDLDKLKKIQPYQVMRKSTSFFRGFAFFICQFIFLKTINLRLLSAANNISIASQIKNFIGSIKRFRRIDKDR